jgi:predicted flap endonuclease-1-like 5' DNA nuclease
VTDRDGANEITVLEEVRRQLEARMRADTAISAARRGSARDRRDSAVYRSWKLVSEAIHNLRSADSGSDKPGQAKQHDVPTPDDLTSIRGIDAALAGHLASLGITNYAEIASWRAEDVHRVSRALGLNREISRQNWIEQAALLQHRKGGIGVETASRTSKPRMPAGPAPRRADTVLVPDDGTALADRIETILKDDGAEDDAPSALALELASQTLNAQTDERVPDSASPAIDQAVSATTAQRAGRSGREQQDRTETARSSEHRQPPPAATSATSTVRADATEWTRGGESTGGEALLVVDEAEVTFVVRNSAASRRSHSASWMPAASPPRPGSSEQGNGEPIGAAGFVAGKQTAQEADVVVVKRGEQTRYVMPARSEGGPVRRFIKALTRG